MSPVSGRKKSAGPRVPGSREDGSGDKALGGRDETGLVAVPRLVRGGLFSKSVGGKEGAAE